MSKGPCAKQRVQCHIVYPNGESYWGENECLTPQQNCLRGDLPSGEGYELCHEVCKQLGHAEAVAVREVLNNPEHVPVSSGGRAYLYGHTYFCKDCKAILHRAGVTELYVMGGAVELSELPPPSYK